MLAATALAGCDTGAGEEITLYHAPARHLQELIDRCDAAAGGRYHIIHRPLPRDADGQREQLVRRLAAGDTDPDILGLDVTWVPEFAEAGWLEAWTGPNRAEAERGVLARPLATARWRGVRYAAAASTNVQLLWYDKSLTPVPPRTWDELMAMARDLKARGEPYEILFTGAQYEGVVVQYNNLVASAGGRILSEDGRAVVMDEGAVRGLEILQTVSVSGLTNPGVTSAREAEVHRAFAAVDSAAAFQLNWPDALAAARELNPERAANLAATTYPGVRPGRPGRATLGGINLGVSSHSESKPEAFEAALCLRGGQSQKYAAICAGVPPAIEAIYADNSSIDPCPGADSADRPSMITAYPMREVLLRALRDAAARPRTPAYQHLSTITAKVLAPPSQIDPPETAERLRAELARAIASRGVLP